MMITTTLDDLEAAVPADGGFAITGKAEDGTAVTFTTTSAEATLLTLQVVIGFGEVAVDADPERIRPS